MIGNRGTGGSVVVRVGVGGGFRRQACIVASFNPYPYGNAGILQAKQEVLRDVGEVIRVI